MPNQVGKKLYARTHIGPIGFTDSMIIQEWVPAQRCAVQHVGRVVRGIGVFSVSKLDGNKSRFTWEEVSPVPFGFVGHAGLALIKPFLKFAFNRSLSKMKANIETS